VALDNLAPFTLAGEPFKILLAEDIIILPYFAATITEVDYLRLWILGNSPHALTHALMPFSVLFYSLLNLSLIKATTGSSACPIAMASSGLRVGAGGGSDFAVDWR
jgi:hypothetical protein